MSREIPFDENAICDVCGKKGAFDFMGDYLCAECSSKAIGNNCKCGEACDCDCDCDSGGDDKCIEECSDC
jgi:hypothetical protein